MKFLRNIDISKTYGVSPTSVTNWIESAKSGRNQLQLVEQEYRHYILDTANNHLIMTQLAEKGKIFKTKDSKREVSPSVKFYDSFSSGQVAGIILGLDTYSEIPNKYTYINGGAEIWKAYVDRSVEDKITNVITNTIQLTKFCNDFLLSKAKSNIKFNVIDIGPGDAVPIKNVLEKLVEKKLIHKYIGVDISNEMLEIAETNVKNWFGLDFPFEGYITDITENIIRDISFYNSNNTDNYEIINVIFFLGSTLENQLDKERTLLNLRDSLRKNDYLVLGQSLDSPQSQTYFDFGSKMTPVGQKLYQKSKWIPDLLGIQEEFYHVERYYDDKIRTRKTDIILNLDLTIHFKAKNIDKKLNFSKGDRITVWRHSHHSFSEVTKTLSDLRLFVEFYAVSNDRAQILTISGSKI